MLEALDLNQKMKKGSYESERDRLQVELRHHALSLYRQAKSLVIVFEGWDAAGKGGSIRRLTAKLDPRSYQVYAIAAPHGEDRTHHYLWRFWHRLRAPEDKQILIFDRSWYGRVLVERVEGLASREEWRRAYREINEFERQLTDAGISLVKFFLHLSSDEQERRFEIRRNTPHKRWKLTEEDWRNRSSWQAYEAAIEEMLTKTSTLSAPWTVVPANDKYWARIEVLRTVVGRLASLKPDPPPSEGKPKKKRKPA